MKPGQNPPGPTEGRIDWSEIRRGLASSQESPANGTPHSPEEKRSILRARARVLAREPEKDAGPQEAFEIIRFRLAGETYGIASAFVREVYPLKELTPLPGTPTFVLGIINVRGRILSVVDLRVFFNLPQKGLGDLNKVIILSNDRMEFGILADAILATQPVMVDAIQPAPLALTGIGAEYLKGVTGERVIILDAEKILEDKKIIVYQEVAGAESEYMPNTLHPRDAGTHTQEDVK